MRGGVGGHRRARLALAGLGQDFQVKALAPRLRHTVNQADDLDQWHHTCRLGRGAEAAVEVQEVGSCWQCAAPFAWEMGDLTPRRASDPKWETKWEMGDLTPRV